MIKNLSVLIIVVAIAVSGYFVYPTFYTNESQSLMGKTMEERFDYLSNNGNSACSMSFKDSIMTMADSGSLMGSCCSKMSMHMYQEQTEGLKKYSDIREIPPDPYNVEAGLAKEMMGYYDVPLSAEEQAAYDYAMENSHEKGPCCCKCWRWYVYGGLGKYLIKEYKFSGEQLTELWDLSDGCGGEGHNHNEHG